MAQITSVKGLGNNQKSLARLLSEQHFLAEKGNLSSFLSTSLNICSQPQRLAPFDKASTRLLALSPTQGHVCA